MSEYFEVIKAGKLASLGLLNEEQIEVSGEVLQETAALSLETARVLFADQHGVLRGKTIVAEALQSVFLDGLRVPATLLLKDTSHRTVFPVWQDGANLEPGGDSDPMRGAGDVLLIPRPETFRQLPWSPHSAWLFCEVAYKDGLPVAFSSQAVLERAIESLGAYGLELVTGLEVEFHVFETLDPQLHHGAATMPPAAPVTRNLTQGYQFLTGDRYGAVEEVMDDLRRNAVALKLPVRSVEIEMGPSQFEFTFDPAPAMQHADNLMMFRAMVKEVCRARGLHATFMTLPAVENCAASGWHLHQSLVETETGRNVFMPEEKSTVAGLPETASQWIAGLLENAAASCLLTTPTVNGYKRYKPFQLAPDRIAWGEDNRGAMVRSLICAGDPASRIENRVPESAANPYLAIASQIISGLDGISRQLTAPPASERPYDDNAESLPESLFEAIDCFASSDLFKAALGKNTVDYLARIKRAEWQRYHATVSQWEQDEYFSLF